jgi:uncharacterized protein (DUF983 family)
VITTPFVTPGDGRKCSVCGHSISNVNQSGLCRECITDEYGDIKKWSKKAQCPECGEWKQVNQHTVPGKPCSACIRKSAEYQKAEAKRKRGDRAATKAYREKAHRIVVYRQQVPKGRVVDEAV